MSKLLQMRVNDAELAVISLGAKQRNLTMTGLVKEAVHYYLSHTPRVDPPKRDKFDVLLEMLDKGPKFVATPQQRKKLAKVRRDLESGKAKMISVDKALEMVDRAIKKKHPQ